jgi:hypothetical protein
VAKEKLKNCCRRHPARIAAVDQGGVYKCWECYLGRERFLLRFQPDFYPDFEPAKKSAPAPGPSHLDIRVPESTWSQFGFSKEKAHA